MLFVSINAVLRQVAMTRTVLIIVLEFIVLSYKNALSG